MTDDDLVDLCRRATGAVAGSLASAPDWGLVPGSAQQHHSDLAADAAAVAVLTAGGLGVLSEESGISRPERPLWAVLDPLDGSTNAAQGIHWYACSICVVDEAGPRAGLVTNLASGVEYRAVRGAGAWRRDPAAWLRDPAAPQPAEAAGCRERRLRSSGCGTLAEAIVGVAGLPDRHLGWRQFRALGAAALDLCLVAEGTLDAWFDCSDAGHGVWDYLAALLIGWEAGVSAAELRGQDLVTRDVEARRWPVVGASAELVEHLTTASAAHPAASRWR